MHKKELPVWERITEFSYKRRRISKKCVIPESNLLKPKPWQSCLKYALRLIRRTDLEHNYQPRTTVNL